MKPSIFNTMCSIVGEVSLAIVHPILGCVFEVRVICLDDVDFCCGSAPQLSVADPLRRFIDIPQWILLDSSNSYSVDSDSDKYYYKYYYK